MNTVLIKEVNNSPVIFNVDNMTDEAVLEALQAIKMPESIAAEIFDEQRNFADNTTCSVTSNPDNPAFPWDVAFDATKIPEKPKRNTGTLAGIGMPSKKYIDYGNLVPSVRTEEDTSASGLYNSELIKAPANGYVHLEFLPSDWTKTYFLCVSSDANPYIGTIYREYTGGNLSGEIPTHQVFLPILKDYYFYLRGALNNDNGNVKFFYAQGELEEGELAE